MTADASLRRLLRSLLVIGWAAPKLTDPLALALEDGLGGVILHSRNVTSAEQLRTTLAQLRERQQELVVGVDQEGGRISHLTRADCPESPGAAALGVLDDVRATRDCAVELADHLRGLGIDASYSPVVDVQSDPRNPIIRTRSFGGDTALVQRHARAWIEGTQSVGVAACAKHFPGHGATAVDSHLGDAVDGRDWERIAEHDLEPFRAAIDAGVAQIMTSHVRFPQVDDLPATASRRLITDVARGELNFDGVIITDALEMAAIADRWGVPGGAVRALMAGADQLCIAEPDPALHEAALDAVEEAVRSGILSVSRLEESSARIRTMHQRFRRVREEAGIGGGTSAAFGTAASRGPTSAVVAGAGFAAARGAVAVRSRLPRLEDPVVVDLYRRPKPALEWDGSDLGTLVTDRCPTAIGFRDQDGDLDITAVLRAAASRSLVVATQDLSLHPGQQRFLASLRESRPDLVHVETGLSDRPTALNCYGRGTANLVAAAESIAAAAGRRVTP